MTSSVVACRKFIWKLTNFTSEALDKYKHDDHIDSDKFEILIDENNTIW